MPDYVISLTTDQAQRFAAYLRTRLGEDEDGNPIPVTIERATTWLKERIKDEVRSHEATVALLAKSQEVHEEDWS